MNTLNTKCRWTSIIKKLSGDAPRLLMLDYDGTLAPFKAERDQAFMPARYRNALEEIRRVGRTRLVIISGRAVADLIPLLDMTPLPEIWGSHGWERLTVDGEYIGPSLPGGAVAALEKAAEATREAAPNGACEIKPSSVAVHWRGMTSADVAALAERIRTAWTPLIGELELELHEFDGGLELRATGRDKGYAVTQLLREMPPETAAVYAGDDYTDEDAFRTMSGRGSSILVRAEYRPTAADLWLKPPDEWTRFLEDWMRADAGGE